MDLKEPSTAIFIKPAELLNAFKILAFILRDTYSSQHSSKKLLLAINRDHYIIPQPVKMERIISPRVSSDNK